VRFVTERELIKKKVNSTVVVSVGSWNTVKTTGKATFVESVVKKRERHLTHGVSLDQVRTNHKQYPVH
jgi:hypothetical protein